MTVDIAPRRIATLDDAIAAGLHALEHTKPYCMPLIEAHALRLLIDAANAQLAGEKRPATNEGAR